MNQDTYEIIDKLMRVKVLGKRADFRRCLGNIRKSSLLKKYFVNSSGREVIFNLNDTDENVIKSVIFEYLKSQNLEYEELQL